MMKFLWRSLVPGAKPAVLIYLFFFVLNVALGAPFGIAFNGVLWALNLYSYDMQRRGYHA